MFELVAAVGVVGACRLGSSRVHRAPCRVRQPVDIMQQCPHQVDLPGPAGNGLDRAAPTPPHLRSHFSDRGNLWVRCRDLPSEPSQNLCGPPDCVRRPPPAAGARRASEPGDERPCQLHRRLHACEVERPEVLPALSDHSNTQAVSIKQHRTAVRRWWQHRSGLSQPRRHRRSSCTRLEACATCESRALAASSSSPSPLRNNST